MSLREYVRGTDRPMHEEGASTWNGIQGNPSYQIFSSISEIFQNLFEKRVGSEFELLFVGCLALSFHHHLLSSQPTKYADWLSTHILSSSSPSPLRSFDADMPESDPTWHLYFTYPISSPHQICTNTYFILVFIITIISCIVAGILVLTGHLVSCQQNTEKKLTKSLIFLASQDALEVMRVTE